MIWTFLLGCILAIAMGHADVVISFRNDVLSVNARVVNYDYLAPGGLGQPLVNTTTRSFAAQLHWTLPNESNGWQPIGESAPFREIPPTDPLAGTWQGTDRVIPGLPPETEVWLKVEVYSYAPGKGPATRCGFSGWSQVFSYRNAQSSPTNATDTYMVNFLGFPVRGPLCPAFFPQPQHLVLSENDEVLINAPPRRTESEWLGMIEGALSSPPVPSQFQGIVARRPDGFYYRPVPHSYGTEYLQQLSCCDPCLECSAATICIFSVQPSARRPYLAVADDSHELVLRGLAERRYRLDQSPDLTAWTPAGEFIANYSEVPLLDLTSGVNGTRFFRLVDLSQ